MSGALRVLSGICESRRMPPLPTPCNDATKAVKALFRLQAGRIATGAVKYECCSVLQGMRPGEQSFGEIGKSSSDEFSDKPIRKQALNGHMLIAAETCLHHIELMMYGSRERWSAFCRLLNNEVTI